MDMSKTVVRASLMVISLVWASTASVEFIVKRVQCQDANEVYPVFMNQTSASKTVAVQITRDGCFPKGSLANFYLNTANSSNTAASSRVMPRLRKRTPAVFISAPAGWITRIFFQRMDFTNQVRGTFDYVLEIN